MKTQAQKIAFIFADQIQHHPDFNNKISLDYQADPCQDIKGQHYMTSVILQYTCLKAMADWIYCYANNPLVSPEAKKVMLDISQEIMPHERSFICPQDSVESFYHRYGCTLSAYQLKKFKKVEYQTFANCLTAIREGALSCLTTS